MKNIKERLIENTALSKYFGKYRIRNIENLLETMIFASRWLLTPFYVGLVIGIMLLLVKFTQELIHVIWHIFSFSENEIILGILSLIDISLIANLLLIIIFIGYESFVSKIQHMKTHIDRPEWMGQVDFSGMKIKLIGSIVAISAIELLKIFIDVKAYSNTELSWKVGIHGMLVVSGLMFALMDKISSKHQA
ncbi:TIGR00645 family protein [Candidatus Nitrosacidococcus tergens]|uniref:UPF0114 protein NSCAC_0981 n=1 Tax=Candidatus Nitrosacidococcus tergens TaxID=553981 RepID=A0A7G1Q9U9_9GAMM|nr:TIGR00645 family protein [Candidatus Nitrosacidococcus tergens]CAB1276064.1 conserved membrane protein of unknown function [Candidatus Nitrosacidococcus tergens]